MKTVHHKKDGFHRKTWGCPRTKNRSAWCHAYCIPHDGLGDCGRIAPHSLVGRTRQAIIDLRARRALERSTERE